MISKGLLELLVKENVIINSIKLNENTNEIEYKTAIAVDRGIEIVTRYKNVFDLAFNCCFEFVESKGYNLRIVDTERFSIIHKGVRIDQPRFDSDVEDKYYLCRSAFKCLNWFVK